MYGMEQTVSICGLCNRNSIYLCISNVKLFFHIQFLVGFFYIVSNNYVSVGIQNVHLQNVIYTIYKCHYGYFCHYHTLCVCVYAT